MGKVISFEERAVARLRERLGAAEEARQDLLAFARGHSGAVASIHEAMLAALEADSLESLFHVVTHDWPPILGVDSVALALVVGGQGFRADSGGVQKVETLLIDKAMNGLEGVLMRNVGRGHPLFGPACGLIRSEALVRIDPEAPLPYGLLALGQCSEQKVDARHGSELLLFLGRGLAAMIRRWLIETPTTRS